MIEPLATMCIVNPKSANGRILTVWMMHEQQREEIDRTRAGYGSATRTSAYATTPARKRTSAVLRLK